MARTSSSEKELLGRKYYRVKEDRNMEKGKGEHRNAVADCINLETLEGRKSFMETVVGYLSKGYDIEIRCKKDGVAIYVVTKKKALMAAV